MTASAPILAAFAAWKDAEHIVFLAEPCDDDVMDRLTDFSAVAFHDLQAIPAESAADMLLKLFPILLRVFEPAKDAPPLRPGYSAWCGYEPAFFDALNSEISRLSPQLLEAINLPGRVLLRGEA